MARLTIRKVRKFYDKVEALKGIDLEVGEGEFCVFVGPSGCGKSTLLRSIAGLEDIDEGEIAIDGAVVNDLRPRDRDIAMVFQNYALYPFLTVFENIAFGLRARKTPDAEVRERVHRAAEMLGVTPFLDRTPRQLSGGQRQRVAIGRAVVRDARLFLFDEPLSNLDAQLRDGMRAEIKRLHQEIGKTTIYVTHDQIEAMTLADRIVLLRDGQIEQQGAPLDLFERPATRFVAGFLGSPQMNFIPCQLQNVDSRLEAMFADGRSLRLPSGQTKAISTYAGGSMILGVRPEHMRLATLGATARLNEAPLRALIDLVQPTGSRTYAQFRLDAVEVSVEMPAHSVERPGAEIDLLVDMDRVILIDPDTDHVIPHTTASSNTVASVSPKAAEAAL
ncbi:MAG: sn-glycerol-3-phosphate ABC transporter ATP-binding protein UgpC [Rhodobacteraceae bacterium]|nr:sn-glycerol-3-phosphate ABC transporter ATP-binding protein UgpC [Paracoccaceae bacterium]